MNFLLTDDEPLQLQELTSILRRICPEAQVFAYVEIPGIDVSLPIYHGTSEEVLQVAVGHIEYSAPNRPAKRRK